MILNIERQQVDTKTIAGFHLDAPGERPNFREEIFRFQGWVLGASEAVPAIDVEVNGLHTLSIPVNLPRPDVAAAISQPTWSGASGFSEAFEVTRLPKIFEIDLFARGPSGTRIHLYRISGNSPLSLSFRPNILPVAVTTIDGCGSALLLEMLKDHGKLAVCPSGGRPPLPTSYWLQFFLRLGDPISWTSPLAADDRDSPQWIFGAPGMHAIPRLMSRDLFDWFFEDYVHSLFSFCMARLEDSYRRCAVAGGKRDVKCFLEPMTTGLATLRLRELIPTAKEIFLVRDFRDIFCRMQPQRQNRYRCFRRKKGALEKNRSLMETLGQSADRLYAAWRLRRSSACIVRYEELVRRPETVIREILEHLELPGDESAIKGWVEKKKRRYPVFTSRRSVGDGFIGRFRTQLTEGQLDMCRRIFGNALDGFGYDDGLE